MKKIFSILIVVCLVFWGIGCEEKSNLENEIKPQENAIPNFGVTYQEIITSLGENDYNYKEVSQYDFENNVGYGTKKHIEAIKEIGITRIHRLSFLSKIIGESECERLTLERRMK